MVKENKDPLDEIFVDYHKSKIRQKEGQWEFKKIDSLCAVLQRKFPEIYSESSWNISLMFNESEDMVK